jgi:hypothetical protein
MNPRMRDELKGQLLSRGFTPGLESPNSTMVLDDTLLDRVDIGNLLDMMVTRREKVFRSVEVVGQEAAKRSYDDVVLVIEAIEAVIAKLSLP